MNELAEATRLERLIRPWAMRWGLPGLEHGVTVSFDPRIRRSLGRCSPGRGRITLHPALRTAPPKRLAEVLCHEVAHVAAFALFGPTVRPHGAEWAALVSQAGYAPATRAKPISEAHRKSVRAVRASRAEYEHRCPVCQSVRFARRAVRGWRCAECVSAGLSGTMNITRRPSAVGLA